MKEYKKVYALSMYELIAELMIPTSVTLTAFIITLIISKGESAGYLLISILWLPAFLLLFTPIVIIANLIMLPFNRKITVIDERTITYDGKAILLCDINKIVFSLAKGGRSCSTPRTLTVSTAKEEQIKVTHPSPRLIRDIRKQCKAATFEIEDLKFYFIFITVLTILGIICAIATVLS